MSQVQARRLVVTGHDEAGKSRFVTDTTVAPIEAPGAGGVACSLLWGSDSRMHFPDNGEKPTFKSFFPPLEGYRLIETYLPPHGEATESIATVEDLEAVFPGMAETMDPDRPGMHRTASVDLVIVMEGRCVLELEDGEALLAAGDVVVESGTIHAWRNPYGAPCRFLAVVVGAKNDLCP